MNGTLEVHPHRVLARRNYYPPQNEIGVDNGDFLTIHGGLPVGGVVDFAQHQQARRPASHAEEDFF
jgi:hypothetical protein